MKDRLFLLLLAVACFLSVVKSQCDLGGKAKKEKAFPDIMKAVAASYVMGIEVSTPKDSRIDYYVEYYDAINKRGRMDVHTEGENVKYLYRVNTWEQWLVTDLDCTFMLINESVTPNDNRDAHYGNGSEIPTTIGPSSSLKIGLDAWNKRKKGDNTMAYMGEAKSLVRGEVADLWRQCTGGQNYTDYYFAASYEENPSDSEVSKVTPLRVAYHYGDTSVFYDIMSFQRTIPAGVDPFQLPVGMNCKRSHLVDGPKQPNFALMNIYLDSEVLYKRFSLENDRSIPVASYYSTLTFALDRQSSHLLYITSEWNSTKPNKDEKDKGPKQYPAEYIVYDSKNGYFYNISQETGNCEPGRKPKFYPRYVFPQGRGSIAVTDNYVFLPNNELKFFAEGKVRGLDVNIFELEVTDMLVTDEFVHKAIVTHSYLKPNVKLENTIEIQEAPVQMELRLYRDEKTLEILTFNVFGFTTLLPREFLFDVTTCYRNDDDYSFLTLGFEVEDRYLEDVRKKLYDIEYEVVDKLSSELNVMRIPNVETDMKKNYVYVTLLILEKPPFELDFTDVQENKTIVISGNDDKQGVSSFRTCAQNCLEARRDCWGFSMCGDVCYYGSPENQKKIDAVDCTIYGRYSNESSENSKDLVLQNIFRQVNQEEFTVKVVLKNEDLTLVATFAQETDPAADDSLFEKMGNFLDSQMTVLRVGAKLKHGTRAKNLGRLRYDECQSLCVNYKDCETVSYCLSSTECLISTTYAGDLNADEIENNTLCNLLAKKYSAHFDRTPGLTLKGSGGTSLDIPDMEDCARACLKESKFDCLSFDHCGGTDKQGCTLYKVHYLDPKDRKENGQKSPRCGHYTRKLSADFKRKDNTHILGSKIASLYNLTLEQCAKTCVESEVCYGYDFCQDQILLATSCTIFDTDPSRLDSEYSATCAHYARTAEEFSPRPYTNSYAGGIGFLCFLVGIILGGAVIFTVYKRRNRG